MANEAEIKKINEEYLDHLMHPKNYGKILAFDGKGIGINPENNERVEMYINVEEDRIIDIKYQAIGCTTTVTGASILSEIVKGETLKEVEDVLEETLQTLQHVPPADKACGELVAYALKASLSSHQENKKEITLQITSTCEVKDI